MCHRMLLFVPLSLQMLCGRSTPNCMLSSIPVPPARGALGPSIATCRMRRDQRGTVVSGSSVIPISKVLQTSGSHQQVLSLWPRAVQASALLQPHGAVHLDVVGGVSCHCRVPTQQHVM
jgi:hypothetical protein